MSGTRSLLVLVLLLLGTLASTLAATWYVKFIHMTRATEPELDYLSQWATLTFAVPPAPGKTP